MGAAGLAFGLTAECYQPGDRPAAALVFGAAFGAIDLGLTTGGIASLVMASKEARKTPMTKRRRRGLIAAGAVTTFGALAVIASAATINRVDCANY